jgi:hypothetical protein
MTKKYVVTYYRRYAIYEPAEGGYFYEGLEPYRHTNCMNYSEALKTLKQYVFRNHEDVAAGSEEFLHLSRSKQWAFTINRYIGSGEECHIEAENEVNGHAKGKVPYK